MIHCHVFCGGNGSISSPILTILQRTMEMEECNTFCGDSEDTVKDEDHKSLGANHSKFASVRCLCVAPTTVLAVCLRIHCRFMEFMKSTKIC